jgi:hypothetical protein
MVARDVGRIAFIDRNSAGNAFIGLEAERAAADDLRDRPAAVTARQALGHDGADGRARLAERGGQQRERTLQAEAEGAVVDGDKFIGDGGDGLGIGVADGPAADAGDAVPRQHRGAIVEGQAGAQRHQPGLVVVLDAVAFQHLRRDGVGGVGAIQSVIHHHRMVAGDVGGGPGRIDDGQIGMRNELEDARRAGRGQSGPATPAGRGKGRRHPQAGRGETGASSSSGVFRTGS